VLGGLAGGLAALRLGPRIARAQGTIGVSDVARGLKVLRASDVNVVTFATGAGLLVVDSGPAADRDRVVAALRDIAGGNPVATLVNTHWHRDQTGANEALGMAGATIVAHDKTRQRLATGWYVPAEDRYEQPLPKAALPTKTFFTTDEILGGVEVGYLIAAHTDGDLYVRFPDVNVIAVGDVVSPERDPKLDWFGGGWLGGRLDALGVLLALGDANTRYIPSVGPVIGRAQVQAEHDLLTTVFDRMVVNLRLGQTPADMEKAGVLDGLPRKFEDPAKFLYDAQKGFWANHNKLMHDIV
jgi:glyoxylase-like metal-dependent hydrolase (beta-lactamase superfamily II)